MQQTKKFKMADAISPYLAVSCGLILSLDLYTASVAESLYHTGQILGMCPANERRRYKATPFLIGWAQTENQPWLHPVWYYNSYITLLGKV